MDRLKDSSLKETDPSDDLAPETFDEGAPFPGLGCIRESHGEGGLGKVKEKGAGKDQGLENFEKSDPDTCGHIACMVKGKRGGKTVGGIAPVVDPGVKGLSAGPSCDPADPIEMSHFGKEDSRILEAILKPSMVGVDSLELRDLPGEIVALPEEVSDCRCGKGCGDAPGDYGIKEKTVAKNSETGAVQSLSKAAKKGEGRPKTGIISQSAKVSEVVGNALPLEKNRPNESAPFGRRDSCRLFDCLGKNQTAGHRRIARNARGESRPLRKTPPVKERGDSLVGVAHSGFESEDLFPHNGKSEMSGFNNAGMDWSHWNLVHPLARDPNEGIVFRGGGRGIRSKRIVGIRKGRAGPESMVCLKTKIGKPFRSESEEIPHRPFEAPGRREES